jgi:hypothetical protein
MAIGFTAQAEGLYLPRERLFYCASDAALASIANIPVEKRRDMFLEAMDHAVSKSSPQDLSYLRKLSENTDALAEKLGLNQHTSWAVLRRLAQKRYGSSKILTHEFVTRMSHSLGDVVSADIESRRLARKQQQLDMTVNRPFVQSIAELKDMQFENGSAFEMKLDNRVNPIFPAKPEDAHYLSKSKHADVFNTAQTIGFTRYAVLLEASKMSRAPAPHIFLPFDFAKNPDLAYELLVRSCAPEGVAARADGFVRHSMIECDAFLEGKKSFTTPQYSHALRSNAGAKAVLIKNREMEDGMVYMLHSMLEQCLEKEKLSYQGMCRLFTKTENETVAVHFAGVLPGKSYRSNVYIIVDEQIRAPTLLYADANPALSGSTRVKELDGPLREKLNASAEFLHRKGIHIPKMFHMNDPLGNPVVGRLYRANSEVMDRAASYAKRFGWSASDITMQYARLLK